MAPDPPEASIPRGAVAALLLVAVAVVTASGLGLRGLQGERAALREAARAEVARRLEQARAVFLGARANALRNPPVARLSPEGELIEPAAPRPLPTAEAETRRDAEGRFFLETADRLFESDPRRAGQLLAAARADSRAPAVRLLAALRARRLGEAGPTADLLDAVLSASPGLVSTREGALAMVELGRTEDAMPALLAALGGPDDALARAVLTRAGGEAAPPQAARDRELALRARLLPHLASLRSRGEGSALDQGPDLLTWSEDAGGHRRVHLAPMPRFAEGVSARPGLEEGKPGATRASLALPEHELTLHAHLPADWLARREGPRLALMFGLLGTGLLALAGAVTLAVKLIRRERRERQRSARFVAQLGHDLRTPIAAIRLWAETLATGRARDLAEAREIGGTLQAEAEGMGRLAENALLLARLDARPVEPERTDLRALVAEACASRASLLEDGGLKLHTRLPDTSVTTAVDPGGLRALLDNLIQNALAHAHGARQVIVELSSGPEGILLAVQDDGPGWPTGVPRDRLLERFTKGRSESGRGTGLGLALVHEQARAHGGRVGLLDAEGGGARVEVRLFMRRTP